MEATSDLRAFVRVAEHQSFSAAASVLGLTPSAVSKLISRLEERLGVRLLHRTTRRVALTSEGDVYFARARQILADIEEAEVEVAKSRGSPRDDCASIPVVPSGAACTVSVRIPRQLSQYRPRIVHHRPGRGPGH